MRQLGYIASLSATAWLIIHIARWYGYPLPYVNGQLTDLLATPLIASACVTVIRYWVLKNSNYRLPLPYILFIAAYLSIAFEWIMPTYTTRYTADWLDVAAYFTGGLLYHFFITAYQHLTKTAF
ncbi:hypothetical protein KTO58_11270 [Chitinophaga pendula]|uniref:hypothetical protein n=1 Tax=Chitinophaga TaxID=79328 RepID=UPI000BAEB0EA|nr:MULTISPECIES: hypothetical protein [Chitinophaga]ASZ12644.1 hypothetical protein CK934_17615 [Chitinophaga sp. MD30]UCJ09746.1 hypothetical protein KTO58_11270 [Chitinophaga pendula]